MRSRRIASIHVLALATLVSCGQACRSNGGNIGATDEDTGSSDSGTGATGTSDTGTGETGSDTGTGTLPVVGGCSIFTGADAWNRVVTSDSVDAGWTTTLYTNATIKKLHPDFGSSFGIP